MNFSSYGEGLGCFMQPYVLPKIRKITATCPNSVRIKKQMNIDLPEVNKRTIDFESLKVSKMTSLKTYMSPVVKQVIKH